MKFVTSTTTELFERVESKDAYSSVFRVKPENGMEALETIFPSVESVGELNFVLFSTSGVHGSYTTLEELKVGEQLTFLIISPRIVCLRYGTCIPETKEEIAYLKELRARSHAEIAQIGMPSVRNPTGLRSWWDSIVFHCFKSVEKICR